MSFETKVHSSVCNIAGHFHRVLSFYSWFLYISVNMWKLDISGGGLLEICSNYEYSGSLMKFLRLHEKMGHPSPYRFSFCRLEASFAVVFWSFSCSRVGDNYCACVCVCVYYGGTVLINERCLRCYLCISIYRNKSLYYIVVGVDNVTLVRLCRVRLILFVSLTTH